MARLYTPSDSNLLLAALGAKARAALEPHLETVDLNLGKRLSVSGKAIRYAYFPDSGMISLIHTYHDGATTEVDLVGREGFWGSPLALESKSSPIEAMVQGQGSARRISAKALMAAIHSSSELRSLLLRFANYLHVQTALTAACNGRHEVTQRLARWLMEASDRLGNEKINLSHEFLGYMLGVRRAGVTAALGSLKTKECVAPKRGSIQILNRHALEEQACECYGVVRAEYRHVLSQD